APRRQDRAPGGHPQRPADLARTLQDLPRHVRLASALAASAPLSGLPRGPGGALIEGGGDGSAGRERRPAQRFEVRPQRRGDTDRGADVVVVYLLVADGGEGARHEGAHHRVAGHQRAAGGERAGEAPGGAVGVANVLEDREADDGVVVRGREVLVVEQVGATELGAATGRDQGVEV